MIYGDLPFSEELAEWSISIALISRNADNIHFITGSTDRPRNWPLQKTVPARVGG
jgi:hypothetical protein